MAVLSVVRQCPELSFWDPWTQATLVQPVMEAAPRASNHLPGTCTCGSCEHSGQLSLQSTCVPSNTRVSDRKHTDPQHDWHPDLSGSKVAPLSLTQPSEDGEPNLQDPCWVHKKIQPCIQAWEAKTFQAYLVVKGEKIWKPQKGVGDQFGPKGEGGRSESGVAT